MHIARMSIHFFVALCFKRPILARQKDGPRVMLWKLPPEQQVYPVLDVLATYI